MNETSTPLPNPRKPKNGWRLANHKGFLHTINKKGALWMIKKILNRDGSSRVPVKVTSIPGCNIYNRERIRLVCKRVFNVGSHTLLVGILKTKSCSNDAPEIVCEFFLEEGEFCEIIEDENGLKQNFVKKLVDVYVDEPEDEILVKEQIYRIMVPKWIHSESKHAPQQALTLFNDGQHLYVMDGEEMKFLSFYTYKKETSSDLNAWMKFLENEVMFKTFGHTLDGSVVIFLREKQNHWSIAFTIKRGQTATVDELISCIGIYFSK